MVALCKYQQPSTRLRGTREAWLPQVHIQYRDVELRLPNDCLWHKCDAFRPRFLLLLAAMVLLSFPLPLHTLRHQDSQEIVQMNPRYQLGLACLPLALVPISAQADLVRVYVTNSAGDSIHVIDAADNKVVQEIKGIEGAHGIAFSPDAARVYVSDEASSTLDVFDRKS